MNKIKNTKKIYVAIDLKSFYASVECRERGLDPMNVNLVVADGQRTEKTICLAVSPTLKTFGLPGRPRLFEVTSKLKEINYKRRKLAGRSDGKSYFLSELKKDAGLSLDMIIAPPRMQLYMDYSSRILSIYLKYVSTDDIYVYSVDEVFIDITGYVRDGSAQEFVENIVRDIFETTGITASAGIGENIYLAKVAMDIMAKRAKPNIHGARIGVLTVRSYREKLWGHTPVTDFWRVGRGYAKALAKYGIYTMGDIARESLIKNKGNQGMDLLYKLFGKNAGFLIEHAWGIETTEMADIKSFTPEAKSISSGQVLKRAYTYDETKTIIIEMAERLSLLLLERDTATRQITLTLGYDVESLADPETAKKYRGAVVKDFYGRDVPEKSHGSINLSGFTGSAKEICRKSLELFEKTANPILLFRRITIAASDIGSEDANGYANSLLHEPSDKNGAREKEAMKAVLRLKGRYGGNSIFKGLNLKPEGTALDRNGQIGGHKA